MMYNNRFKDNDEYKAKIDTHRSLDENILRQIKAYFKISFTYTSNAIESNSLSLNETKIIIEDGIAIGGKPVKEHLEVIGNSNAYDLLFDIANQNISIDENTILSLHKILYLNIDEKQAGKYRDCNVLITGSEYELAKYNVIPKLMKEFLQSIETNKVKNASR